MSELQDYAREKISVILSNKSLSSKQKGKEMRRVWKEAKRKFK